MGSLYKSVLKTIIILSAFLKKGLAVPRRSIKKALLIWIPEIFGIFLTNLHILTAVHSHGYHIVTECTLTSLSLIWLLCRF